jgi:hypothetical protein
MIGRGLGGLGKNAEIAAMVERLKSRGLVKVSPPLSTEEVRLELSRIRNEGRPKGKAKKG